MSRTNSASTDDWDEVPSWFYDIQTTVEINPSPPQSPNSPPNLDNIISPEGLPPPTQSPGSTIQSQKSQLHSQILDHLHELVPQSQYNTLDISSTINSTLPNFSLPIDLTQDDINIPSSTFCSTIDNTVSINPASLQQQLDHALKRINHLSRTLDRAEADTTILENKVESLEHQLSLAKVRETALSSENSTLKKKLEAAPQSEISALKLHNKALQDALNKANAKHNRFADDTNQRLTKAKGEPPLKISENQKSKNYKFTYKQKRHKKQTFLESEAKIKNEVHKYGATLLQLSKMLKEAAPEKYAEYWASLSKTIVPLLVGRFELSSASLQIPLRKSFHHMLIHLNDLPVPLVRAVGSFLSSLLSRIDNELPTAQLITKILASPVQSPSSPSTPKTSSSQNQIIQTLNQQHAAILDTLTQLSTIKIDWATLPTTTLKTTLSIQTRNMLDTFLLSIDNRLQEHIFQMKGLLSAAININGGCLQAIVSTGVKSRREFENLLTSLTNEDDKHFATKKQMQDLLVDFRRLAGFPCTIPGCITC